MQMLAGSNWSSRWLLIEHRAECVVNYAFAGWISIDAPPRDDYDDDDIYDADEYNQRAHGKVNPYAV